MTKGSSASKILTVGLHVMVGIHHDAAGVLGGFKGHTDGRAVQGNSPQPSWCLRCVICEVLHRVSTQDKSMGQEGH